MAAALRRMVAGLNPFTGSFEEFTTTSSSPAHCSGYLLFQKHEFDSQVPSVPSTIKLIAFVVEAVQRKNEEKKPFEIVLLPMT